MASFEFSFPAINAGTTFVFGSWVCIADRSGGFSSHLINPTNTEIIRQEQLSKITSAEILLPQLVNEIEKMSFSDTTSTRRPSIHLPLALRNSVASYSASPAVNSTKGVLTEVHPDSSQLSSYLPTGYLLGQDHSARLPGGQSLG